MHKCWMKLFPARQGFFTYHMFVSRIDVLVIGHCDGYRFPVAEITVRVARRVIAGLPLILLKVWHRDDGERQLGPALLDQVHHILVCSALNVNTISA